MAFGKRTRPVPGADQRRDARRPVAIFAMARPLDGAAVQIAIEDLSAGGFRAMIPLPLREGLLLRVRLPNGRSPHARVVRVDGNVAGCEFISPLEADVLQTLVQ